MLLLFLVLGLVVAPTAAFAQSVDLPPVPCGNLSDEDCSILQDSRDVMQNVSSYSSELAVDVELTDVPSLPADLGFSLDSVGSFSFNPEVNQRMLELQMNPGDDMMANMEELMAVTLEFYAESDFDLELSIGFTEDVAALIAASSGLPLPDSLDLAMRLVDGNFYLNADTIAELTGDPSISGWLGFDMVGMLEQSLGAMDEMDPAMLEDAGLSAIMGATQSNMAMSEQFNEYVDVERLDDAEIDGVPVAEFLFSFDLAGYVSSPEFLDMLMAQVEQQMAMQEAMGEEMPMSESDLAMITDMLPMFAPMLLSGVQWETVSSIGLDDGYVYETNTNVDWDLGSLAAMVGSLMGGDAPSMAAGGSDAYFGMTSSASNWGFDEEKEIVAPDDAMMLPLDEMMSEM
jgi:hypothetical protein